MMKRRISLARASVLSEMRQVRVIANNEDKGRDDVILVSSGIDLTNFRENSVILWQHNPDWPIARALTAEVVGTELQMLIQFPAVGTSELADEIFGLVSEKVISGISTGFDLREWEPIDPKRPQDGMRITSCELQEVSFVSIPALPSALVTERGRLGRRPVAKLPATDRSMAAHRRMAKLYAAELAAARPSREERKMQRRRALAARFEMDLKASRRR